MEEQKMKIPEIGLVICNSGSSNTGALTGTAAMKIVEELGEKVGICSLPALVNNVPRQINLVKKIPYLIVVDGCHNECAKKILEKIGIKIGAYINIEYDLGIKKIGPFTTLQYSPSEAYSVYSLILKRIKEREFLK
jgi:uncharacterized metal-binding protein